MTRRIASSLLLLAVLFPALARGDETRAPKPILIKGDTWTFKTLIDTPSLGRQEAVEQFIVTFANESAILGVSVRTFDGKAVESDWAWDSNLNYVATTTVGISGESNKIVYSPGRGTFRFPLKVGDKYDAAYEVITGAKDYTRTAFRFARTAQVVGWQEVTVPAGKFRALLIESDGVMTNVESGRRGTTSEKIWYSPEVRNWVKSIVNNGGAIWQYELLTYKLADQ
jgi:hypothetical protein